MTAPLDAAAPNKQEQQPTSSGYRKPSTSPPSSTRLGPPDDKQALKCPRCDSSNTKFCYYNNYSLTQPRHFCKTCRRYWTKGGALRNVPIGGGCRKNKKLKSSKVDVSAASSDMSSAAGFKFFPALSPGMDFQFSGLAFPRTVAVGSRLYGHNQQYSSPFGAVDPSINTATTATDTTTTAAGLGLGSSPSPNLFGTDPSSLTMGFNNFPIAAATTTTGMVPEMDRHMNNINHQSSSQLASSIESLSCINQDMHWKLQQQRLAVLLAAETDHNQKHGTVSLVSIDAPLMPELQPVQIFSSSASTNNSNSGKELGPNNSDIVTEWLFGNSGSSILSDTTGGDHRNNNSSTIASHWGSGVQAAWAHNLHHH